MDTREELRPYKKQRLSFEGVLVSVIQPNKKNAHTYGLVFGSVYAKNEDIELDHVVIQMSRQDYQVAKLELFNRYRFSAEVGTYYKTAYFSGLPGQRENFMLQNININKLKVLETPEESFVVQPTRYIKQRIKSIVSHKNGEVLHTYDELIHRVVNTPNDGSCEKFINDYNQLYQYRKVNHDVITKALYEDN